MGGFEGVMGGFGGVMGGIGVGMGGIGVGMGVLGAGPQRDPHHPHPSSQGGIWGGFRAILG